MRHCRMRINEAMSLEENISTHMTPKNGSTQRLLLRRNVPIKTPDKRAVQLCYTDKDKCKAKQRSKSYMRPPPTAPLGKVIRMVQCIL